MTEEEREIIKKMRLFAFSTQDMTILTAKDIRIILNLIQKQNKVIDLVIGEMKQDNENFCWKSSNEIKEYFIKKVEEK